MKILASVVFAAVAAHSTCIRSQVRIKPTPVVSRAGMLLIRGGEFDMGAQRPRGPSEVMEDAMQDAQPVHRVSVSSFWIDKTDVTNEQFAKFVAATGYVTVAERKPKVKYFPGAKPTDLVPGSIVFSQPEQRVSLDDPYRWWSFVPGASWRHPFGPKSTLQGHWQDPVVQVAYVDAEAYAAWAHKRLPTEAEWEFAARGGLEHKLYAWGNELNPDGKWMANTHQGSFPDHDSGQDGYVGIAPVAKYPANGYGLYDMAGNVWQWVADWYRPDYYAALAANGTAHDPQGPAASFDPAEPSQQKRVQRGGSFLCSSQYCVRYMVGARGKGEISTGTNHVGFRCASSASSM